MNTIPTHYERLDATIGSERPWARAVVQKLGVRAYDLILFGGAKMGSVGMLRGTVLLEEIIRWKLAAFGGTSLYRLTEDPEVIGLFDSMARVLNLDGNRASRYMSMLLQQAYQQAMHSIAGRNVYELSPGLAQHLMLTELRGVPTDDLRLPHRNIYLQVPRAAGLRVFNDETGMHPIDGIYITEDDGGGPLDLPRSWRILACGEPRDDVWDDALVYFHMPLPPGISCHEAIERETEEKKRTIAKDYGTESADVRQWTAAHWPELFQLAMNAVVYATRPDAGDVLVWNANAEYRRAKEKLAKHPKGSKQHEKARALLRETPPMRRIMLGRNMKPFEGYAEARAALAAGKKRGTLTVRTLVAGHWQRFATGEGRANRIWKFRAPFWRGPKQQESRESTRHVLQPPKAN